MSLELLGYIVHESDPYTVRTPRLPSCHVSELGLRSIGLDVNKRISRSLNLFLNQIIYHKAFRLFIQESQIIFGNIRSNLFKLKPKRSLTSFISDVLVLNSLYYYVALLQALAT